MEILLIEDDENDVLLIRRALTKASPNVSLHIVCDGEEAIQYLSGAAHYADRSTYPIPDLVLLDIRMPKKNGLEVLRWIREESPISTMPVVIVSASNSFSDQTRAWSLEINSFVSKTSVVTMQETLVKSLPQWELLNQSRPPRVGSIGLSHKRIGLPDRPRL